LGVSTNQVARARDAIVRERLEGMEVPKLALLANPEPPPKRRKVEMLFSVEGDRLFSANREPAEVEA
jgi:hypothetical protein